MTKVDFENLEDLAKKYPNNYDLGRELRNFLNQIKIGKKEKINGERPKGDGKPS